MERQAEVGGGHSSDEGVDNITRQSEGPLAGCARMREKAAGVPERVSARSRKGTRPMNRGKRLGRTPTPWRGGMRLVDCPGERRVIEKVMHGTGRGCRKRTLTR